MAVRPGGRPGITPGPGRVAFTRALQGPPTRIWKNQVDIVTDGSLSDDWQCDRCDATTSNPEGDGWYIGNNAAVVLCKQDFEAHQANAEEGPPGWDWVPGDDEADPRD
jgi:hypothetical protein